MQNIPMEILTLEFFRPNCRYKYIFIFVDILVEEVFFFSLIDRFYVKLGVFSAAHCLVRSAGLFLLLFWIHHMGHEAEWEWLKMCKARVDG